MSLVNCVSVVLLFGYINIGWAYSFKNENFKLVIYQDRNGINFEGVRIDNEGLTLGKYFYEKRLFSNYRFHYKTVHIDLDDLDPLLLYRLEMFLFHNENLKNIDVGSSFQVQRCSRQNVYSIVNGSVTNRIVDTNYCQNPCYNLDVYLLDELENLVNDIIPDGHSDFRLPSYNYPCRD